MKTLKKLPLLLLTLGLAMIVMVSCEDEFTQEDLANYQDQQLEDAVAALNNKGAFASALIKIVTIDGSAVEGATVNISGIDGSGAVTTSSAVSDATGYVSFADVFAGGNSITVSAENHIEAQAIADIGEIEYALINNQIAPVKQNAVFRVPLFPLSGDTATIAGKVSIETDLTNFGPEYVAGLEVKSTVNISTGAGIYADAENASISSYVFTNQALGIAFTDSLGNYSMTVPALPDGDNTISYSILAPNIQMDQRLAYQEVNGTWLDFPIIDTVTTAFGPDIIESPIVQYSGFYATFDAPPTHGRGLDFNLTQVARDWDPTDSDITSIRDIPAANDNAVITARTIGSYSEAPAISITDESVTGEDLGATAEIRGRIASITAEASPEASFGANATVVYTLFGSVVTQDGTGVDVGLTTGNNYTDTLTSANIGTSAGSVAVTISINATASGTVTQAQVDSAFAANAASDVNGFSATNLADLGSAIGNLILVSAGNDDTLTVTIAAELAQIDFYDLTIPGASTVAGNAEFLTPVISLSGGGAGAVQADVSITEFGAQYQVAINNSSASGYLVPPTSVVFEYESVGAGNFMTQSSLVNRLDEENGDINLDGTTSSIVSNLLVVNDSTFNYIDSDARYLTGFFTSSTPQVIVTETESIQAKFHGANVTTTLNGSGGVSSLSLSTGTQTSTGGAEFLSTTGSGYTSEPTFTVTAVGDLPGSGATFSLNGGSVSATTGLFTFGGLGGNFNSGNEFSILTQGSGYHTVANKMAEPVEFLIGTNATSEFASVSGGETLTVNIHYGTGERVDNVR